ncbi:MAG: hypothetical protein PVF58_11365 [Candidatus Methanofastidiosia archaeon]|jgi:hypothetical protein
MKSYFTIPIIFFLFFISGYVAAGYARHYMCEGILEEHVREYRTTLRITSADPIDWEVYHEYLGSPEAGSIVVDPVFKEEINILWDIWLDYLIEYEIEVLFSLLDEIDDDRWSLWDAHKKRTIFEYQRITYWMAGDLIYLIPSNDSDWGGSLAESIALWEAAGGKREGDWMEVYKQSPYYETWLNEIFAEITDPKRMKFKDFNLTSKEDQYLITTQQVDLPFFSTLLWKDMLETERRMAEIAYERYLIHVAEKDFVRANMDSWIVEFVGYDFYTTTSNGFRIPCILQLFYLPLRKFIIDVCAIVAFSIISTFLVIKIIIPRLELKNKKE